jgi:hypothetical protein
MAKQNNMTYCAWLKLIKRVETSGTNSLIVLNLCGSLAVEALLLEAVRAPRRVCMLKQKVSQYVYNI